MPRSTPSLPSGTPPLVESARLFDGRVCRYRVAVSADARGVLSALPFACLPLQPRRLFWINQVASGTTRGGHAHRSASQLLVRLAGEIRVECHFRGAEQVLLLDDANPALLVRPGIWSQQTYLGTAPALLVLSDEDYDPATYIHEQER